MEKSSLPDSGLNARRQSEEALPESLRPIQSTPLGNTKAPEGREHTCRNQLPML